MKLLQINLLINQRIKSYGFPVYPYFFCASQETIAFYTRADYKSYLHLSQ